MRTHRLLVGISAGAFIATGSLLAQGMFGGGPRSFGSEQMAKIFGKNDAFSAVAEMTVQQGAQATPMQMELQYAFLKGNLRTEMDQSSMKGMNMPPEALAQMKQMGMDQVISIYQSDKREMYLVYPGLKAYCQMSAPSARSATNEVPQIEVTKLGEEKIDGHPCVKNKIAITGTDGKTLDIIAWQAHDLKNFPIKTEMESDGGTITTHFRDIKLSAPDASLFQPPADFTRYSDMQEMMMSSMKRMMGGQ